MRHLRYMLRGMGNLPRYGEHPGTVPLLLMLFMGAFAGLTHGGLGEPPHLLFALWGVLAVALTFGAAYLCGAYSRGREVCQGLAKEARARGWSSLWAHAHYGEMSCAELRRLEECLCK